MQQRMSLAQFAGRPTLVFAKADAGPTGGTVAAPSFDPGARGVHSTQQRRCAGGNLPSQRAMADCEIFDRYCR